MTVNLGIAQAEQGDLSEAEETLSRAIRMVPDDETALLGLARIAYDTSDFERAAQLCERVGVFNPADTESLVLLAYARRGLEQTDEAAAAAEKALDLDPALPYANLLLAELAEDDDEVEAALGLAGLALDEFERQGDKEGQVAALWQIGWSYYLQGEHEEASAANARALELDPDLAPVLFNEGLSRLTAGDEDGARRAYERALEHTSLFDLQYHGIDDLRAVLDRDPLPGGAEILTKLEGREQALEEASRSLSP